MLIKNLDDFARTAKTATLGIVAFDFARTAKTATLGMVASSRTCASWFICINVSCHATVYNARFSMLSTFAVLLGIYMFVMLVGNMHLEFDDQRNTGLHVRTLMAVYQVLVVCAILGMQSVFLFFIGVVKRDSISFVLV